MHDVHLCLANLQLKAAAIKIKEKAKVRKAKVKERKALLGKGAPSAFVLFFKDVHKSLEPLKMRQRFKVSSLMLRHVSLHNVTHSCSAIILNFWGGNCGCSLRD